MRMFLAILLVSFLWGQAPPKPPTEEQQQQLRQQNQQLRTPAPPRLGPHPATLTAGQNGICPDQQAVKLTAQDKTVWCLR